MRSPSLTTGAVLAAALCCMPAVPAHAAQPDPNDPDQARKRYQAPPARQPRFDLPGIRDATAEERAGLGLLSVIDQFQADLSRLALDRGVDPEVQAWAESVLDAHASARGRHDPWLPDLGQPRAQARIREGQRELAALRTAQAHEVSAAYVRAMQRSLTSTLQLLDDELVPDASTPGVIAHLRGLRAPLVIELASADRLGPSPSQPGTSPDPAHTP